MTDSNGCGTSRSPWIISANPGQTIQLTLTDFWASKQSSNLISCPVVYGFILEKAIGINETICGGKDREMALYTSKTNKVIIRILGRNKRNNGQFVIKYRGLFFLCRKLNRVGIVLHSYFSYYISYSI